MLGDDEHPISIRMEPRYEGAHVKVRVWAGLAGMRGDCGTLTMRPEEFAVLRIALATAPLEPLERVVIPGPSRGDIESRTYKDVTMEPFEFGDFDVDAARDAGRIP